MASPRSAVTKKKKGKSTTVKSAKPRAKSKKPAKAQPVKRRAKTSPRKKTPASKAKSAKSPKKPAAKKSKSPPKKPLLGKKPKPLPPPPVSAPKAAAPAPPKPLGSYSFVEFAKDRLQGDQIEAVEKIDAFLQSGERCLVVKGFAGTGKTYLLELLNAYLIRMHRRRRLMAPTGRAARMLRDRTKSEASTIHSAIYKFECMTRKQNGILFTLNFLLGTILNEDHETIAIVDEASLISDKPDEKPKFFAFGRGNGSGQLLTDLIAFLKLKDETFKTKLILFGDPCQLPPVLDKQSFALDTEFLKRRHRINAESIALNTVVRQAKDSGIVQAATLLRHSIEQGAGNYLVIQADGVSVKSSTRASILKHAALTAGVTPIPFTVIVFSNEMARDCNKSIRLALGRSALSVGDRLIVCANNRVFGLLNGTFVKVIKLADDIEEFTEIESNDILRFQDLDVEEEDPDKDGIRQVRTIKLFLNAFEEGKPPDISDALRNTLFRFARQRYSKLSKEEKKNSFGLNQDLYFNAVRAKYGYAITCHKAQGGEWPEVGIIFEKRNDVRSEKFRKWTYTALTRAKEVVYLEDAPEIHPLTRIKMQVEHGSVSQEIRMQARIAGKYSFGSPIEFLSLVLTDILAEHDINISSHSKLKQCVRITFSDTSNIESPESTVIDFYYTGEDRVAMFEKGHAPNIKEMNPALAKFILEKLAVRILPQAYLDRLEISKNQDSAGAATLAP